MASQHTSTPHLDGYLKGIKDEFDCLNRKLDETMKERDEYITKFKSQAEQFLELRQRITRREGHTVCQKCEGRIANTCGVIADNIMVSPLFSPISTSGEYYSSLEGEGTADRPAHPENSKDVNQLDRERDQAGDHATERDGSNRDEMRMEPTVSGTSRSLSDSSVIPSDESWHSAWSVEFNGDTKTTLNLNLVHKLTQKGARRIYVAFSTDGKYLATASDFSLVSIFDSKTGKRISVMRDLYYDKSLPAYKCLAFSPDSKYLATGESDGKVRVLIISQRRIKNIFRHRREVNALDFSPDGQWIATCSMDGTVIIWRLRDGSSRILTRPQTIPCSVRFSTDGRYVASGCGYPWHLLVWEVRTGRLVANWEGHSHVAVASLVFTLDGTGLLSASWDGSVIHWGVASLRSLQIADPPCSGMIEISRLVGHTDGVNTVSISPDGKWIASGSWDKTVRIWNAHDATLHCILHCPGWVWSVDFSPVGKYLAIGGELEELTIWNYENI